MTSVNVHRIQNPKGQAESPHVEGALHIIASREVTEINHIHFLMKRMGAWQDPSAS
jgi:hypothetical protein